MARHAPALYVLDGSNLATEGRVAPSLEQLREAVQSLQDEHPKAKIVVVVDATFEHRVATKDRKAVKEAELSGELVAPPAGTIGRGDAFVLAIAQRTKGTVVSNDSFQEFQADHSWLFDDGRLIGGKPVPHVGWVFTERNPVRASTAGRTTRSSASSTSVEAKPAIGATKRAPVKAIQPALKASKQLLEKLPEAKSTEVEVVKAPRSRTVKKVAKAPSKAVAKVAEKVAGRSAKATTKASAKATKASAKATKASVKSTAKASKRVAKAAPVAKVTAEKQATGKVTKQTTKRASNPVNKEIEFARFVSRYPIGSKVRGEVIGYTAHGATVMVTVGAASVQCYAPLRRLGNPAPARARDVVKRGETRQFKVEALDAVRFVAELGISKR